MKDKFIYNLKALRLIFIFENNMRRFIKLKLIEKYGEKWIEKLNQETINHCKTQKEKSIKYLSNNLLDENILNYSMLSHLRNEIINNFWSDIFSEIFNDIAPYDEIRKKKVLDKFIEIEIIRNFLSHSNLIDEKLILQLQANINFFRTYIKEYDENIHLIDDHDDFVNKQNIIKNVISLINNKSNVSNDLLKELKGFDEIIFIIKKYNKIPKTRDKFKLIENFLKETQLIQKLNNILV